jgi:hypothetical protein
MYKSVKARKKSAFFDHIHLFVKAFDSFVDPFDLDFTFFIEMTKSLDRL